MRTKKLEREADSRFIPVGGDSAKWFLSVAVVLEQRKSESLFYNDFVINDGF